MKIAIANLYGLKDGNKDDNGGLKMNEKMKRKMFEQLYELRVKAEYAEIDDYGCRSFDLAEGAYMMIKAVGLSREYFYYESEKRRNDEV